MIRTLRLLRQSAYFFSLALLVTFFCVEAQSQRKSPGDGAGSLTELRVIDRSGLTRFSTFASEPQALEISLSKSSGQEGRLDAPDAQVLLTNVDGLSARVRGQRKDALLWHFERVSAGTWRVDILAGEAEPSTLGSQIESVSLARR